MAAPIVTLNVGGQIFQTTRETLSRAGPDSLLFSPPAFIDRDPLLFSHLLSLLRAPGRLPSSAAPLLPDLARESLFYNIPLHLLPSPPFLPFSLRPRSLLPLPGRSPPSALSPSADLLVAHGPSISSFDPLLLSRSTLLTPLPFVDHLAALRSAPAICAAGASDFPGLHLFHLPSRSLTSVLHWSPHPHAPNSTVLAVSSSATLLFSSFDSVRRNAHAVAAFDADTSRIVAEFGRGEIVGAAADAGIPATKLRWVEGWGLLMSAGVHRGPVGASGEVRLWDVRSGEVVWEGREAEDCFADIAASEGLGGLVKVGERSGAVSLMDVRRMDGWTKVGGGGGGNGNGKGCKVECCGDKVFVTRGGEVEMWSEVVMGEVVCGGYGAGDRERVMKSNVIGNVKDGSVKKKINGIGFVGNRMVLTREGDHFVEVWESPVDG